MYRTKCTACIILMVLLTSPITSQPVTSPPSQEDLPTNENVEAETLAPDESNSTESTSNDSDSTESNSTESTTNEPNTTWYINKPIDQIEFRGLQSVQENDISAIYQPYIGEQFSNSLILELQRRLYALEYFSEIIVLAEDIDNRQQRVRLVFQVTENPIVADIVFEGNNRLSNLVLREEILLKEEDVLTSAKLRIDSDALEALYVSRGFPLVQIEPTTEEVNNQNTNRKRVIFNINEGNQTLVRTILFEGNQNINRAALASIMNTKAQSLFQRGELSEITLEQDRTRIVDHYQESGYIDAEVKDISRTSELDEERERIFYDIVIFIEEGEQYTFGGFEFNGNSIYTEDELRAQIRMNSGDLLNIRRIESDFQRIANLYYDNGYIFNSINRIESRDVEKNIVNYTIEIVERDRAHIENIILRGNTKTKDHVILRELPFEEGEVFSASKIRSGILALFNLQYFNNILPETPQGSSEGLMDLIINVEEGQTADIRFGLSFGGTSQFPISLQLGWQDRNFLGEGFTFGAEAEASFTNQEISVNFLEPWLTGEPWSIQASISFNRSSINGIPQDILAPIFPDNAANAVPDPYTGAYLFSRDTTYQGATYNAGDPFPGTPSASDISTYGLVTDYEYAGGSAAVIPEEYLMNYVLWGGSVGLSTGYRFATPIGAIRVGGGLSTRLEYIEYNRTIHRPFDQQLRDGWNRISLINKLFVRTALDNRDIFYNPSTGYYIGEVITFTGGFLFGDRHYIRSDTKGEVYFTLFDIPVAEEWNFKLVFGVQTLFSAILSHFIIPAPYNQRIQPVAATQELLYIDGVFYGRGWPLQRNGQALWDTIIELKMPIAERIIWLDFFAEAISLWTTLDQVVSANLLENLRFTFGGGVRFTIPQFPIRLYLAKRFRVVDGMVQWQTSSLFNASNIPGGGIDLVFSIGTDLF